MVRRTDHITSCAPHPDNPSDPQITPVYQGKGVQ